MEGLWEGGSVIARFLLGRGIGVLYFIAFLSARNQFRGLLGEKGILPVTEFMKAVPFWRAPSLFYWRYSDRLLSVVVWTGMILALLATFGITDSGPIWLSMATWLALYVLYLSIVNVGQVFYAFGWESILLEAGFLAAFLGPLWMEPSWLIMLLVIWLVFRLEFGAGLIKLRGDQCWRKLTCLFYHHETQPLPGPLSWFFHHIPKPLHKVEVVANFFVQLVVPFCLFLPQPFATIAALFVIITQSWLMISGNYAWLNAITIVLATAALGDSVLTHVLPIELNQTLTAQPEWFSATVLGVVVLTALLSIYPIRNMLSPLQIMNTNFNPFHLVGTYGAFGSVTKQRFEVLVEGTNDTAITPQTNWHEYEFKGKPGNVKRHPRQVAPYHLRLDWLMWFLPFDVISQQDWFPLFLLKLLEGDKNVLKLLGKNPFPDAPPKFVRAQMYLYRYSTWQERRETGAWWVRTPVGEYLPPISL